MCQLNSISVVTDLWRSAETRYDAVVYLRPDVLYNCPFPVKTLENLEDDTVYVPDFHEWSGVNDRFAMGKPHAVVHWGNRCAGPLTLPVLPRLCAHSSPAELSGYAHACGSRCVS